jgi:MEMO1 family protein
MSLLSRLFRRKPHTWRPPALAGHLYPADEAALRALITDSPDAAPAPAISGQLRALVVPFAEVAYMHPVAHLAWRLAAGQRWTRVVLLAPALRIPFAGLAAPSQEAFRSPLGDAWLDRAMLDDLVEQSEVARTLDAAHEVEAALEVLVPYVQVFAPDALLVPILVGDGAARAAQGFIEIMAAQPGTLVVVATELSRELPEDEARALDAQTAELICARDADAIGRDNASGRQALGALLRVADAQGWEVARLALGTSASASGDAGAVVGYGAFALVSPDTAA